MYGSKEFLKFLFIVDFSVCFCVFVVVYITYAVTVSGKLLYSEFCGFHGLVAAMLVAVKQVMPHHEAKLFGALKIRVKVKIKGNDLTSSHLSDVAIITLPPSFCSTCPASSSWLLLESAWP